MRILVIVCLCVCILIAGFIYSSSSTKTSTTINVPQTEQITEVVEERASYAIFTNGLFRVFTDEMYHKLSPDVYIESSNPNIVYVKKTNITWDDFFSTLPFKLSKECLTTGTGQTFCTKGDQSLRFYLNGVENPNALDGLIQQGDQLLITYGDISENQLKNQLQQIPEIE